MKQACIIIPHIDDDIYSCWSVLSDMSYDKIVIVRCSSGPDQESRLTFHDRLVNAPSEFVLNPNIECVDLFGEFEKNPLDGCIGKIDKRVLVTALDRFTSRKFDEFYYPGRSHHQDHDVLNQCCLAALRPRKSNKVLKAMEYTYMYNHRDKDARIYRMMTIDQLNRKMEFLDLINLKCNIYGDPNDCIVSVNSREYVEQLNRTFGIEKNGYAAELFILTYEVINHD